MNKVQYRLHEVIYHRADGYLDYDFYPQWSSDGDVWHTIEIEDNTFKEDAIEAIKTHKNRIEEEHGTRIQMIEHKYTPISFERDES